MPTVALALSLGLGAGIVWDAPQNCPDVSSIERQIADAGIVDHPPVHARVKSPVASSTWQLEVELGDAPTRTVEGESCAALADALVAMVILQGDEEVDPPPEDEPAMPPPAVPGPPPLPAAEPPSLAAAPRPTAPPADSPPPATRRRAVPSWVIGIDGGVHGLGVPGPGGGAGVRLGVAFEHLRLSGYGQWWFRRTKPVRVPVEAAYRLAVGGLEACGVAGLGRLEALGCGVIELGELRAQGLGAAPSRTKRHLWLAPGGAAGLHWRVRAPVRVGLGIAALAPLVRERFTVGDLSAGEVGPIELRGLFQVVVVLAGRGTRRNRDAR
jgi:hypothetical protein